MNDFCLIPGQGLKALHLDPNFHWMTKPPSPLGGVYMTPWRLSRRRDYTPVPSHGSIYLFTWYHHKMSCRRESRQREFTPVVVPGREFHSSTKSRNGILWTRNDKIRDANFPHLQSMAELRRNQRGEIWRQHVKAHSCSHFSPCFDHTSLTQTNDGTSQIDHDIGAYVPFSFRTMSRVVLRPHPTGVQGWRRQDQRLNLIAQWRDHLYWERSFTASMISPVY